LQKPETIGACTGITHSPAAPRQPLKADHDGRGAPMVLGRRGSLRAAPCACRTLIRRLSIRRGARATKRLVRPTRSRSVTSRPPWCLSQLRQRCRASATPTSRANDEVPRSPRIQGRRHGRKSFGLREGAA
jgi:hypothetical protein